VADIRIEPGEQVWEHTCEVCGGVNRRFNGYAYGDDYAWGVYYVEWCDGDHPERIVWFTLSLGAWGEGTTGADRRSFGVEWREGGMRLTEEPVLDEPDHLGEFVPRERALGIDGIDELWHLADHIVLDDPRVEGVERWLRDV
jgi:hypothetical protein